MAKDAKGHGSDTKGMRLIKTHTMGAHSAKVYNNPEWGEKVVKTFRDGVYQPKNDYHTDDLADAHGTAQSQLRRWSDQGAKESLASGPKSAPVPVHDSMAVSDAANRAIKNSPTGSISGREAHDVSRHANPDRGMGPAPAHWSAADKKSYNAKNGYNEHGSRHGYNPQSTNDAIAAQNRSGRGKIGGKEASAIHRLLKGR